MINLTFLACTACFVPKYSKQSVSTETTQSLEGEWSCNEFAWMPDADKESIIKISTYDCEMTQASVYVTKNNGRHLHYHLNKAKGCEWKIMLMLKDTICKNIKSISIIQKYSEKK